MKHYFRKPYRWAIFYAILLTACTSLVLLDTFVIPRTVTAMPILSAASTGQTTAEDDATLDNRNDEPAESTPSADEGSSNITPVPLPPSTGHQWVAESDAPAAMLTKPVITETSYLDAHIRITIETNLQFDTDIYLVDIQLSDAKYLKAALAKNTYGRNIKETTSFMAENNQAILAINGDFYGFRDYGFVVRNGTLYRSVVPRSGSTDGLLIDSDGNFQVIKQTQTTAKNLEDAWQFFSFGPALIVDREITVTAKSEVGRAMTSNPRTAIGQIAPLHYLIVVSDGRTKSSEGLSLLELAKVFEQRDCSVAYNLDGGGSSTLWFNGRVINHPTDGRTAGERSVSDIVYIG